MSLEIVTTRGTLWQPPVESDYHRMPQLNPSSICAGFVGRNEVDVRLIRQELTSTGRTVAAASQDRMDRGSIVHMALLQPERLATDVAVWLGAKRVGKEWDDFEAKALDRKQLIIRSADYAAAIAAANEMAKHIEIGRLLNGCEPEVAMSTNWLGVACRGMVDAVDIIGKRIIDIKTTDAGIGQDAVERTIRNMFYREKMAAYRQWIAYITGTHKDEWRCWNLFLSMTPPYGIRSCKFTTMSLEFGECRVNDAIVKYERAVTGNEWPIYFASDVVDVKPWEIDNEEADDVEWG